MSFKVEKNVEVLKILESYPTGVRDKLLSVRQLIIDLCEENDQITSLEETFKWGEPSYISNVGSTVRLGWTEKSPRSYFLYFICTTKLIDTFRELYGDTFRFEGNRAMEFYVDEEVPITPLSHCLSMTLCYHLLKDKPMLGA